MLCLCSKCNYQGTQMSVYSSTMDITCQLCRSGSNWLAAALVHVVSGVLAEVCLDGCGFWFVMLSWSRVMGSWSNSTHQNSSHSSTLTFLAGFSTTCSQIHPSIGCYISAIKVTAGVQRGHHLAHGAKAEYIGCSESSHQSFDRFRNNTFALCSTQLHL